MRDWGRPGNLMAVAATAGASAGAAFLLATVLQLVPALVDPTRPRSALLPVLAVALLAAGAALAVRWPAPRSAVAPIASATGLAAALAAFVLGGQPAGPAQVAVILGAGLVAGAALPVAILAPQRLPRWGRSRWELVALGLVLLVFVVLAARHVMVGAAMSWDEAVYALTARHWLYDTPLTGWATHRSPGMPLLGTLPLLFVESDAALRAWGVVFGASLVALAWAIARRLAGPAAGLLAAAGVASIDALQADAGRFLTDVPATALLLGMVAILLWQTQRDEGPRRGLLLAAVAAAAAFYVRYGASLPVALVAATALVAWWDAWRRRPLLVLAAAALLLILLVPHAVPAIRLTGTPWGIALGARNLASPAYPGEALGVYLGLFTGRLAGPVAATLAWLAVVGWLGAVLDAARRRRATALARGLSLLVLPSLAQLAVLGVVALPQTRYVFLPIVLLCVAGVVAGVSCARFAAPRLHIGRWGGSLQPLLVGTLLTALVVEAAWVGIGRIGRDASAARTQQDLIDIGQAIETDAGGQSCSVMTYFVPDVTWYSGCAGYNFGYPARTGEEDQLTGERRYLLLFPGARSDLQPAGDDLAYYRALAEPEPAIVVLDRVTSTVAAEIFRIR